MKVKLVRAATRQDMETELNELCQNTQIQSIDVKPILEGYFATVLYEEMEA